MTRKLITIAILSAFSAWAGETFLGIIVSSDGGIVTNATTAVPFSLPSPAPISVQDVVGNCSVAVNTPLVDAGTGIQLVTGQFLTSSTASIRTRIPLSDGGTYVGGAVAVVPAAGTATCSTTVFSRLGNE